MDKENEPIIPKIDILRLQKQFEIAGLPVTNVRLGADLTVNYDWRSVPTPKQYQAAAEIVASHDYKDTTIPPAETIEEKINRLIAEKELTK